MEHPRLLRAAAEPRALVPAEDGGAQPVEQRRAEVAAEELVGAIGDDEEDDAVDGRRAVRARRVEGAARRRRRRRRGGARRRRRRVEVRVVGGCRVLAALEPRPPIPRRRARRAPVDSGLDRVEAHELEARRRRKVAAARLAPRGSWCAAVAPPHGSPTQPARTSAKRAASSTSSRSEIASRRTRVLCPRAAGAHAPPPPLDEPWPRTKVSPRQLRYAPPPNARWPCARTWPTTAPETSPSGWPPSVSNRKSVCSPCASASRSTRKTHCTGSGGGTSRR